jgi:hypothetical protein
MAVGARVEFRMRRLVRRHSYRAGSFTDGPFAASELLRARGIFLPLPF